MKGEKCHLEPLLVSILYITSLEQLQEMKHYFAGTAWVWEFLFHPSRILHECVHKEDQLKKFRMTLINVDSTGNGHILRHEGHTVK